MDRQPSAYRPEKVIKKVERGKVMCRWGLLLGRGRQGWTCITNLCFPPLFPPPPSRPPPLPPRDSHVSLVVGSDFLDANVVLGVDEGLGGGVGSGHRHHAGDVLVVMLVFHFDLCGRVRR